MHILFEHTLLGSTRLDLRQVDTQLTRQHAYRRTGVNQLVRAESLTLDEIKEILRMTEDGTDEIISTRSKVFQKLDVDIDQLPLKDLFHLIQKNPGLLRRPIILDAKRLQVGYNEDEIRRFLPRKVRTFQLREAQRMVN